MGNIKSIGVIGAGQMGSGIAQVSAMSCYTTYIYDATSSAVGKALERYTGIFAKMVEKGKATSQEVAKWRATIHPADKLTDIADVDLVIEAATENTELKLKIFRDLDAACKPSALLTSNTSSISITKIAAATNRPAQVMGVHFMNPPPLMQLVELIRGMQTSDATYNTVVEAVNTMKKTPVLGIDRPGFLVNRILAPMLNEAIFLLAEGAAAENIDKAINLGLNHPMGPLALADLIGLDTCLAILEVLHKQLGEDKYRPCPLLVKYVEAGWLGKKTGRGFYQY